MGRAEVAVVIVVALAAGHAVVVTAASAQQTALADIINGRRQFMASPVSHWLAPWRLEINTAPRVRADSRSQAATAWTHDACLP